jgi:hypothetical protein
MLFPTAFVACMRLRLPKSRRDWCGPVVTNPADDMSSNSEKIKAYVGRVGFFTLLEEAGGGRRGGGSSSEEDDVQVESESESELESESEEESSEVVFELELDVDEEDESLVSV